MMGHGISITEAMQDSPYFGDLSLIVVSTASPDVSTSEDQMPTPDELLHATLHDVFGNRDAASRSQAIERTYSEDVVFHEAEGTVTGRDAIDTRARELLDSFPPDFAFVEDGPHYVADDLAAGPWALGPAGAPPVARGIDILTIRDGLVTGLRTIVVQ